MNIEKAIEVLKMDNELMQFDPNTGEDYPIELQNEINQDIYKANLIAISALEEKLSGWVPVGERLPKEDEEVLITLAHGKATWAYLYQGEWNTMFSTYPIERVIAWQPLPEPYREVKNE